MHTIAEYGSYQYAQERNAASDASGTAGKESSEQPLKQNDHALDATRYALHTHLRQARAADAYLAAMQRRLDGQGTAGEG
jgi:hypothetical protein